MSDLENFRRETRTWLEANCPPEMRRPMTSEEDTFWGGRNTKFSSEPQRVWFERMRDKGWTVPHWPSEYGGGGLDPEQTKIVRQEMAAIGARQPLTSFGISMLGPALLKYGTEAQKKEHLPKIAAGLIRWCQGYSEPNAGSDLASLQTRAESDGVDFIINGQKIWTSYANFADWIFCLVRTDATAKKHDGISFILFDMASKGVSTKPILLISGRSPFCETFFDDVRVPKANVVGTVNRGWDVAKYLLQHERAMISGMGERGVGRPLGQVAADSVGTDEQGRLEDPMLRGQIATFEIDEAALACAAERAVDLAKVGQAHPAFSSAMKYYEQAPLRNPDVCGRHRRAGMGERALKGRCTAARMAAYQGQFDRGRHLGGDAWHRGKTDSRSAGGLTVIPGHAQREPGISRFRVWSFGPSRNDNQKHFVLKHD
jgi:alkylation response protein AidB-like acyl-CoA dehydrogenase